MYRAALEERHHHDDENHKKEFVAVPQRNTATLDIHTYGLLTISLTQQFATYYNHLFDNTKQVSKKFKCLVCVKDPDSMSKLEALQKNGTVVTHYVDHKSPTPKRFVRHKPKKETKGDWQECQMKILQVGDEQFRAACVKSKYKTSVDTTLSHLLWGPNPPEDVGYVMEVQLKLVSTARAHQIRGQLAALGFPIVGDFQYGGGKCELHSHKHAWNRMAMQCCELSFPEPKWKDESTKNKFVASDKMCVFALHEAWWSGYLQRYEHSHSF
jgi:23S rRNA-/tRNA-specific pseudouridylate synthase